MRYHALLWHSISLRLFLCLGMAALLAFAFPERADGQGYQKCLRIMSQFSLQRASRAWPEDNDPAGVALIIYPHQNSADHGKIKEVWKENKWLGVIVNHGTNPDASVHLAAGEMGCLYLKGMGRAKAVGIIYRAGEKADTFPVLSCSDLPPGSSGPHADWKPLHDCSRRFLFTATGMREIKPGDPEAKEDIKAIWVSCATDGCCRIQV